MQRLRRIIGSIDSTDFAYKVQGVLINGGFTTDSKLDATPGPWCCPEDVHGLLTVPVFRLFG